MICRYMPSAQRVAIFITKFGPLPIGMRVGWSCHVPYCGKIEHMILAENLNHGRDNWTEYAKKLASLSVDEYFDIPNIRNDHQGKNKARLGINAVAAARNIQFAVRSLSKLSGGLRIIRTGRYGYLGEEDALQTNKQRLLKHPLLIATTTIRPWQRSSSPWWGQFFNPMNPEEYRKPPVCKVAGCIFPVLHGVGDYCYQHNHWFDFPISMHDRSINQSIMYNHKAPHLPWELDRQHLLSISALERSLRVTRDGYLRSDHRNAGAEETKIKVPLNYSRSPSRLRMRLGGGSHSGSKTTKGKRRAASRQGKGSRHTTKEKRWTRETIESLENQANLILGEKPIDCAVNFIPPDERTEDGEEYERDNIITELEGKSDFERLFGA